MKIIFLSRYFYPHIGGVEEHVLKVGEELIKQGHQITVITMKRDRKLPDSEINRKIKIVRLPFSNSKFSIWKNLWLNRRLLLEADIIHCHDIFFWYLPFRIIYPFKPVFTTFHGWEGKFPIPFSHKLMHRLSELLSWGSICVGDYLKKWYGHKPDYISYGATSSCQPKPSTKKFKTIVFIGRLAADLGLKEYFVALKKLKTRGYRIIFVGDGPLKSPAKKFGVVAGMVKDIKPYILKADYVFCSSYLTIWQALACKRQVFCLYHNPLKLDYLKDFPASKYIHLAGSASELIGQLTQPLPTCPSIPGWQSVARLYSTLWQKK